MIRHRPFKVGPRLFLCFTELEASLFPKFRVEVAKWLIEMDPCLVPQPG